MLGMQPRITMITLGVKDLEKSYAFYRDGLLWSSKKQPKDGVVFFALEGTWLALYPNEKLQASGAGSSPCSIALAHNTSSREEVDRLMARVVRFGAKLIKPAHDAPWGSYCGFFQDLDGYTWEVAHGGFSLAEDGFIKRPAL
jgi:predicted lactoylglutathione lyase